MSKQVGNVQLMQKMNRLSVLNLIRRNPDISRPLIAKQTGLSLSSVTNITSYLLEAELLEENGMEQVERVGRKSTLLRFKPDAYGLILVSLNENVADICYTDLEGKTIAVRSESVKGFTPEKIIHVLEKNIIALFEAYRRERILAISVIFPGLVLDGGRFALSARMKWRDIAIKDILEKSTGLPVFAENISRLKAAWYSIDGPDRGAENMLFVDLANGIGAVQLSRGVINRFLLGEIGHTAVEKEGEMCFCGNRGCLEVMCSADRIVRLYGERSGKKNESLAEISGKCIQGDVAAEYAVTECAGYLGMGLANILLMSHPDVLVLDTGDFADCPALLEEAIRECRKRAYPVLTKNLKIRKVCVSREDTLRGAAFELCNSLFDINSPHNPVR